MFFMIWSHGFILERLTKQTLGCKFFMFICLAITIIQLKMELLFQQFKAVIQ